MECAMDGMPHNIIKNTSNTQNQATLLSQKIKYAENGSREYGFPGVVMIG